MVGEESSAELSSDDLEVDALVVLLRLSLDRRLLASPAPFPSNSSLLLLAESMLLAILWEGVHRRVPVGVRIPAVPIPAPFESDEVLEREEVRSRSLC